MKLKKLIEVVHGTLLNTYQDIDIEGFSIDSRECNNKVFIALRGKRLDSHKFINSNLKASVVISEKEIYLDDIPVIKVANNYDTLYYLNKYFVSKYNTPVIAITGSNGKTTLKELIALILNNKYKVLKNTGNNNNIIGLFNTLKNLDDSYDLCVLEMGMNHKDELSKLSLMTNPTKAFITNIGSAHIGNFKNKKEIFKAKMEITDGLKGDLIVNGDDKYLKKVNSFHCGLNIKNNLMAYNIRLYENLLCFNIYIDNEYLVNFKIPSIDYIPLLLEAIKCGLDYHINILDILNIISDFEPINQRLNAQKINNYTLIDDSYNASYESVKCGLNLLKRIKREKIIILGDMLELGKYSKKYHKKLNKILNNIDNKEVLTIGKYTKYIHSKHFTNLNDIIDYLDNINLDNKFIYIKGSHKVGLFKICDKLKFDT